MANTLVRVLSSFPQVDGRSCNSCDSGSTSHSSTNEHSRVVTRISIAPRHSQTGVVMIVLFVKAKSLVRSSVVDPCCQIHTQAQRRYLLLRDKN